MTAAGQHAGIPERTIALTATAEAASVMTTEEASTAGAASMTGNRTEVTGVDLGPILTRKRGGEAFETGAAQIMVSLQQPVHAPLSCEVWQAEA